MLFDVILENFFGPMAAPGKRSVPLKYVIYYVVIEKVTSVAFLFDGINPY